MKKNSCYFFSFIFFIISMFLFIVGIKFGLVNMVMFMEWEIMNLNSSSVCFSILLDFYSFCFMSFVLFISSMIIFYSNLYMKGDYNVDRFIILVVLFVFSMMLLIMSPNLMSILLGWDGLGLVSYCLVVYYQNVKSYAAGMLTVLSNRVGDVALLLSISWMFNFGSWNFLFYYKNLEWNIEFKVIAMLIILGAMTKSAQIPFSSWLPAAMAAPTPVSALVHSSTLVTAGVYLMIRFSNLIYMMNLNGFLLFIGCLTMFMAGLGANFEYDLKKIIALSTLSQLGFMISTIGLGMPNLAFFHLLTHALFKALLFMCAGVIIHNLNNLQDIRGMGSLVVQMPFISICFSFSNLALCGMPFLTGFYSKDLILELSLMTVMNKFIFIIFFMSVGLTVCYTFRLIYYLMSMNFNYFSYHSMNDEGWEFILPMMMMMVFSVFGGSFLGWFLIDTPEMIMLSLYMKFLVLLLSFVGGWLGFELSNFNMLLGSFYLNNKNMVNFLGEMWFMPYLSTYFVNYYPLKVGDKIIKTVDMGWLEELGGQGMWKYFFYLSVYNQDMQDNNFKIYLISFFIWIIILVYLILY
uniref:NADH-ubiquinone oxidoreductase chain 5 n=1 Tax=Trigonidium sjostedti TaxID=1914573 RepID=A0A1J0M4H7_9ORTH|nr:NADH dehydrogenase subunit 5 [Trigonidium sjostedti]APD14949.1 NADH dehydrogenase subunit 5 [Trigonidium sjostedti]